MMPRLVLVFAATSLIAVARPSLAQDDPQGIPAPGLGAEGMKPAARAAPRPPVLCLHRPALFSLRLSRSRQRSPSRRIATPCSPSSTCTSANPTTPQRPRPSPQTIEGLWLQSGSDTVGVLMGRSAKAINEQKNDLALQLLDAVVELAPDYAEGWNRRAYVYFLQNNYEGAVGDLRRALALDPNHFKALEGLARILRDTGQKKGALQAYKQILKINPFQDGAKEAVDELAVEVEGQGI